MKKITLILDRISYDKALDDCEIAIENSDETVLTLYFPNGEHAMTSETHPSVAHGRRAAKRILKYIDANFSDKTRD